PTADSGGREMVARPHGGWRPAVPSRTGSARIAEGLECGPQHVLAGALQLLVEVRAPPPDRGVAGCGRAMEEDFAGVLEDRAHHPLPHLLARLELQVVEQCRDRLLRALDQVLVAH